MDEVGQTEQMTIEPDTKDWTWVLERPCHECGFDAHDVRSSDLAASIRASADPWPALLAAPGSSSRPAPHVWSPLEYACHVRDVHQVFADRLALMLAEDDPEFENWDQDETALLARYDEQDPTTVGEQLVAAARSVAEGYDAVGGHQWQRSGRRSNGSRFTVETLGRYHLHDVAHHLHDVGSSPCDTRSSGSG